MKTFHHLRLPVGRLALASTLLLTAVLANTSAADEARKAPVQPALTGHTTESVKSVAEKRGRLISFVVLLKDAFPINVLNAVKDIQEVCTIFCATANPLEVVVAQTDQGRGIMGVIDGLPPKGVEDSGKVEERRRMLRRFGYKL